MSEPETGQGTRGRSRQKGHTDKGLEGSLSTADDGGRRDKRVISQTWAPATLSCDLRRAFMTLPTHSAPPSPPNRCPAGGFSPPARGL